MEEPARIVLGVEAPEVAEEVLHFLDRGGRVRVVATATDPSQLREALRQLEPDTLIASPALAPDADERNGTALIALDTRETVAGLRRSIAAGARGFFLWPEEREELAGAAARSGSPSREAGSARARVVAVAGARGGAGATFVATHLAAAFAGLDRECVVVDAATGSDDLRASLGVDDEDGIRTLAELAPMAADLAPGQLREAAWRHREGFGVLFGPVEDARHDPRAFADLVEGVARSVEVVVLHLPREAVGAGFSLAERRVLVVTLDVCALRAARRILGTIPTAGSEGGGDGVRLVVNRAARGEIVPSDVRQALGIAPTIVLPAHRGVPAAQDHGVLLPRRHRVSRMVRRLAAGLLEDGER